MEVTVAQTHLFVPPSFAVWVPENTRHSIRMPCAVSMRTLYFRPALVRERTCSVLHVTPLLRERRCWFLRQPTSERQTMNDDQQNSDGSQQVDAFISVIGH
jgi:hypothetical protein